MKFKVIKESKDTKIEVENPGLLEVPKGKKVYDLPVSHFKKLIDKKGRAAVIRAINALQVWNKNDDPKIASWAKKMKKSLEGYGEKKTKNESLFHTTTIRIYKTKSGNYAYTSMYFPDALREFNTVQDAMEAALEAYSRYSGKSVDYIKDDVEFELDKDVKNESLKELRKKTKNESFDTITRYSVNFAIGPDGDRFTDYVYADSVEEAKDKINRKYRGGATILSVDGVDVPAKYREWDDDRYDRWEVDSSRDDWDEENESLKEGSKIDIYKNKEYQYSTHEFNRVKDAVEDAKRRKRVKVASIPDYKWVEFSDSDKVFGRFAKESLESLKESDESNYNKLERIDKVIYDCSEELYDLVKYVNLTEKEERKLKEIERTLYNALEIVRGNMY